jgi:hypothetical protein
MILFFNIIQTEHRHNYNRLHLKQDDRIDNWKYTLASLQAIPWWTKIYIYCALEPVYEHRREELTEYIHNLFDPIPLELHFHRSIYQREWTKVLDPLVNDADPLIWFFCNDDHPFMDYNLDCLEEIIEHMLKEEPSTCYLSHWPEILKVATACNPEVRNMSIRIQKIVLDAVQIVHREVLRKWFWSKDYGNCSIPRSDNLNPSSENQYTYVPLRELCRHIDGHMHISSDPNANPPIEIPPGFFTNDIKITYCSPKKELGKVHINPLIPTHFAFDGVGADYHWVEDDIPLFWRKRISEIEVVETHNESLLIKKRNESHTRKALMYHRSAWTDTPTRTGQLPFNPPLEWIERGFR